VYSEDAPRSARAGRKHAPSIQRRFAPLILFLQELYQQSASDECDLHQHARNLKTSTEFTIASVGSAIVPSAHALLFALNSMDAELLPRQFAMDEIAEGRNIALGSLRRARRP